ncbi:hypothetical protein [Streptococcus gallolyticus]|uniref:hypothetical protein n=1 Tax=Streptococcus gallolyticus TaxID=315405 RepID=UPI0007354A0C|nr:hypothetical protein [Streptococcus gallolyticus]KUE93796.1 hypothetical protein AU078_00810 [Streptococcus gallolyticus]
MVTFNEAMLSNDRALAIRVGDFTSENIKSANFKYGYITGDDFTPGGTYAGTASILFTSIVESFKKLDVVYPEIGLLVGSKVEWVKMGKYYIDDIKIDRNANTTEIELMDEMFKLNESFKTDLKYPAQIRDVILEIATKTGVTLASDNFGMTAIQQHVSQPTGDKLTFRDVLGQVSQLLGFSCFFNRNGELEVRGLTESGITITADNYFLHGLEKSEVEYQIAGITCEVTNNEKLTVGLQTGRSLEIENPLATQDTLNLLYYALKDIVYYPYDLSYQGHLKLDVGQWVTIKTNKDETLKVPVLYQSFSFSGGLTSTISADSVAGSDAQYTYGSFVTKKIDQKSTQIQAEVQQQLKYADEEFKKVSNEMLQQSLEYQNSVRNELATSKAELETQIDTAKTQAESNAKAYADEINQATAEVAKQANTAANSLKSDLAKVKTDLTATTSTANAAKTSASEAKQQLTTVANDLSTAKQDLQAQASQLTAQASAQSELTKRVSTVEETANGTKTTVSELSKTVDSNTQNITSVTARTKTVEDDLTSTKTTLSQVKTTANSANQKTATLETGLNGLNAKFETLKIGSRNYFKNSKSRKYYINSTETQDVRTYIDDDFWQNDTRFTKNYVRMSFDIAFNPALPSNFKTYVHFSASPWYNSGGITFKGGTTALQHFDLKFDLSGAGNSYKTDNVFIRLNNTLPLNTAVSLENFNLYLSAVVEDYNQNEADIESKVAKYKQTADQNYASLQSNLQTLDGTVKQNKSEFDQTASQLKTSISAVEGKIPTTIGGRNYIQNYGLTTSGWKSVLSQWEFEIIPDNTSKSGQCLRATCTQSGAGGIHKVLIDLRGTEWQNKKMTYSIDVKASKSIQMNLGVEVFTESVQSFGVSTDWQRFSYSSTTNFRKSYSFVFYSVSNNNAWEVGDVVYLRDVQLEDGTIATAPKPAVEDTESDITKLNTTLTQTANGLEQLSTQVTSQGNTITSHTNSINSLSTGLSAKVSQTDFNTLSGRVTTAENNIIAKANELSSKITSVEGRIPTSVGGRNLLTKTNQGKTGWNWVMQVGDKTIESVSSEGINAVKLTKGTATVQSGYSVIYCSGVLSKLIESDTQYVLSFDVYPSVNVTFKATLTDSDSSDRLTTVATMNAAAANKWTKVSCILTRLQNLPANIGGQVVYLTGMSSANGVSYIIKNIKLEKGNIPTDWTPAPEDYDSKLATAQSEIKQTTDAISASVSALDKSTVKSVSLTINTDGIVMKAGKSTTDVANAIGSYFAVNQNAINLFSDKINVKGNMIVSGAITSDKIASKSITTAHLNGKIITADVISSNAITADAIKAGAVTTDKMTANSINGDRIIAGTLDAAKIKAGSITASQIASGTITSSQIKTGGITAANIATGAITTNHLATGSITADKIKAGSITSDMFRGNKITSLNNATTLDLQSGEITFNNIYATINQTKGSYKSQISLFSLDDKASTESSWSSTNVLAFNSTKLTSATRRTGSTVDMFPNFSLMTLYGEKIAFTGETSVSPGPNNAIIITTNSEGVDFINGLTNNSKGTWNYSMIMDFGTKAAISVPDIKLDGHFKSLTGILDDLCKKVGILWV